MRGILNPDYNQGYIGMSSGLHLPQQRIPTRQKGVLQRVPETGLDVGTSYGNAMISVLNPQPPT